MDNTKIEWCETTWNPVTGCFHNCPYCYARRIAERFGRYEAVDGVNIKFLSKLACYSSNIVVEKRPNNPYPAKFAPTFHRYRLNEYEKKKGRNIFVCSMADLFGDWMPDSWIEEVFKACEKAPQHNYLFLTKNPRRYFELALREKLPAKENMWYGSTMTDPDAKMFSSKYHKTFWSIEPILKPFEIIGGSKKQLTDWIIVGAETGRRKDKVIPKREWIGKILGTCITHDIPIFMKSSLKDIWEVGLIQKFPEGLRRHPCK